MVLNREGDEIDAAFLRHVKAECVKFKSSVGIL